MTYFVTGATGFIGRHLVERLLERDGDIYVLVREGSADKLERLLDQCGRSERIKPVFGDISEPQLGVDDAGREQLAGVDHFFHLAAVYDITADETTNALLNVGGTQNAVDLANALGAKRFHHMSSIAVAGSYDGWFTEDDFDEGQEFPSPYHRTKYESEKLVRERIQVPWRVYRPSLVVGNSKTGEMDKVDGPYYFFKAIQKLRHALPQWFPLISLEFGRTNLVPVDYVAAAVDHIAHQDGLDGQAFHIVDPKPPRSGDVLNTFANSAHAPHAVMRLDKRMTDMLPKGVLGYAMKIPALQGIKRSFLTDLGIPEEALANAEMRTRFDARDTARALDGSGIELPKLDDLRRQAVGLLGAHPRPGPLQGPLVRGCRQRQDRRDHRRVERHRSGRRAQDRRRGRHPAAGGPYPREARGGQDGDRGLRRDRVRLSVRPVRLRGDRAARRAAAQPTTPRSTCSSTTRDARSAARWRCPTTASTTTSAPSASTT